MNAPSSTQSIEQLTSAELARIAVLVREAAGIHLPEEKRSLVGSRLGKRVRAMRLSGFEAYCDFVESPGGEEERAEMLHALTTNVTRFFREEHHFQELREELLPPLINAARKGGRLRIWSAGCSSGEEPYSIAMTLLGLEPGAANLDIRVLATDLDPNVLAIGDRGVYPTEALEPAPQALVKKYFEPTGDGDQAATAELRGLITFKRLNLIKEWPIKGSFDAIFCRNVIIYFEQSTQDTLIGRFAELTKTGAGLFLGHSERVSPMHSSTFERAGFTSYRRA